MCVALALSGDNRMCNSLYDDLPACSMVTGQRVADTGCQAGSTGDKFTLPCVFLENRTTEEYFVGESCLGIDEEAEDKAAVFTGRVSHFPYRIMFLQPGMRSGSLAPFFHSHALSLF